MGAALTAYRRYRELLQAGAYGRLTEVVDERWIENCVGLTGWTAGLDIATANFTAGIARAFSGLDVKELDVVEKDDTLVIRGQATAIHSGAFLGVQPTGKRVAWDFVDMYRLGADGRINWHFFVTDWNNVRLQLLGEAPDLPATPTRRAVQAELKAQS
jgi:predicted ester cyclase